MHHMSAFTTCSSCHIIYLTWVLTADLQEVNKAGTSTCIIIGHSPD